MIPTLINYCRMIKIEHTIFSLPFVLLSALLAARSQNYQIEYMNFLWIILCLSSARALGMTLNRIIDSKIDLVNPRTASREIPAGTIKPQTAWTLASIALIVFLISTLQLPSLCLKLLPIALLWLWLYSYLKRFTWLCHFMLGTTLGGGTLGAWIAITNNIESLGPVYLALSVSLWVAGFDISYSIQDYDFDRVNNLHSIPVRFGIENAIKISRLAHLASAIFLYLVGEILGLGLGCKLAVTTMLIAMYLENKFIHDGKIEEAFFLVNSWVSVIVLIFCTLDILGKR